MNHRCQNLTNVKLTKSNEKGGAARAKGVGEKEKESTIECKSQPHCESSELLLDMGPSSVYLEYLLG